MPKYPHIPLWTDAYLKDTKHLTAEQHGIYLLLIMLAWERPDNAIPDDMKWLKRSLQTCCDKLHGHKFNALVPGLLDRYWQLSDGKWTQKRSQKERKWVANVSEKKRKAASVRWKINDLSDAYAMPPIPTPKPSKNLLHDARARTDEITSKAGYELAVEVGRICGYATEGDWPINWYGSPMRAQMWLTEGWPREIILTACREAVARKKDGPPTSIVYFEKAIVKAIARQRQPLPEIVNLPADKTEVKYGTIRDDSKSGLAAIDRVYGRLRQKSQQHGNSGEVSENVVLRLPPRSVS